MLLEICGEHLLVATGEARGNCPDITQLNDAGTLYWRIIAEEESLEAILERLRRETPDSKNAALLLLQYLHKLQTNGYLLEESV